MHADTHRTPYLLNGKAYEFQLGIRMEDDDPHKPEATGAMTSKVKSLGRKVT